MDMPTIIHARAENLDDPWYDGRWTQHRMSSTTAYVRQDHARKEADALYKALNDLLNNIGVASLSRNPLGKLVKGNAAIALEEYCAQHNATPQTKGNDDEPSIPR